VSRVLFDHNVPDGLRRLLPGHDVRTAHDEGWGRLGNGELLAQTERAGFDVLVTADRNLRFQQNLAGRRIAIVELPTNRWQTVREHAERIARAVDQAAPGSYAEVAFDPQPRLARRPQEPGP
jgi:hypothetical protein